MLASVVSDDCSGNIGSVSIIDSCFSGIGTAAVVIAPPSAKTGSGSTGIILENVALSGVPAAVQDTASTTLLNRSAALIDQWTIGPTYDGMTGSRNFSNGGKVGDYRRHSTLLDASGKCFERQNPQYEDHGSGDFVHIKNLGATGDGSTDDMAAFQAALL